MARGAAWRRRGPFESALGSFLAILATVVGLLALAMLVLYVTRGRFLKQPFERMASSYTERQVRVGGDFQFYFDPHLKFWADNMSVTNPEWAVSDYMFRGRHLDLSMSTLNLLLGRMVFRWVNLADGDVALEWSRDRQNSWTFGEPTGKPLTLPVVKRAAITGTTVSYRDPLVDLVTNLRIGDVAARDTVVSDAVTFTGDGRGRGIPFRLKGKLTTPNETLAGGRTGFALHVDAADSDVDVSGMLAGATEFEGADLKVAMRGRNVATVFSLMGIAVPESRPYRLAADLTKVGPEWRFTDLTGRLGDSDIAGSMTIAMPADRIRLTADLRSDTVDMLDIGPLVGYSPERLQREGGKGVITVRGGRPTLLPDAPLRYESVQLFDADVQYRVRRIGSQNVPISNIALTFSLQRGLMKLSPLTFKMAGGDVASDVIIDARQRPVRTDLDLRLAPTPLGRLFRGYGLEESGTTGTLKARLQLKGEGDTMHKALATSDGRIAIVLPRGNFWTRNVQLAELDVGTFLQKMLQDELKEPVQVNCGLIAFTVRDGIAAADPILIDTRKNVIAGRGGFSLRDESLDLAFRADSKTFSLFSGQSPIGLGGYFAAPAPRPISPELLARAGAGLGLGLVAGPLAPVLAFIDPGDAKAADCGPVLDGARAAAQRTDKGKPRDDVGDGRRATRS